MWQNDKSAEAPGPAREPQGTDQGDGGLRVPPRLPRARRPRHGHRQRPVGRGGEPDDAALGQGPRVRPRLPARLGGRPLPPPARARRGRPLRPGRGTAAGLCRHHPGEEEARGSLVRLEPPHPRFVELVAALPASSTSCPSRMSRCARGPDRTTAATAARASTRWSPSARPMRRPGWQRAQAQKQGRMVRGYGADHGDFDQSADDPIAGSTDQRLGRRRSRPLR